MAKLVDRKDVDNVRGSGGDSADQTRGTLAPRDRVVTRAKHPVSRLALACLVPAALSLAACGGGGGGAGPPPGGGVTASLPPLPRPPASAVATPAALNNLQGNTLSASFLTAWGPVKDNTFTVAHDAANDVYVLTIQRSLLGSAQATFRPADRVAGPEPSNFTYYGLVASELPGAPSSPALTLLKDAPDNTRIVLSYLSYGIWNIDGRRTAVFLTGAETSSGDMPRTGSATYHGVVDGFGGGNGNPRLLGSTGTLTANFATGGVTTTLSLLAQRSDGVSYSGSLSGAGTIGAGTSRFDGELKGTLDGNVAIGWFIGGFYGPDASEAGYAFTAVDDWTEDVGGVFVGKR